MKLVQDGLASKQSAISMCALFSILSRSKVRPTSLASHTFLARLVRSNLVGQPSAYLRQPNSSKMQMQMYT